MRKFPESQEAFTMKMFIFVVFVALIVFAFVWRMRKTQNEADLARRKSLEARKKQQREKIVSKDDTIWPAIIRPVSGRAPDESEEPSMTAIEFDSPRKMAG